MMEEVLLELEPKILQISNQGAEFQGQVESLRKSETGSFAADVVTKADYWVQNELLRAFASTLPNPVMGSEMGRASSQSTMRCQIASFLLNL